MNRAEFVEFLTTTGFVSAGELTLIERQVPPAEATDVQSLARLLVQQGKLTKYQAAAIYQAKGKLLVYGDYVVLDRIGAGGMGQVYKARHRRMDRIVALKVISGEALKNPDSVKRFEREVKAAAKLYHPNVVTALDAGQQDGVHYFVMEYVDGPDLSTLAKKHGKLPVKTAVDYVRQAACGLAAAHAKGVVHRDIKPGNLLVSGEGVVKILDLGLARLEDGPGGATATGEAELTQHGAVMGTVDYMAPEQALNLRHADAKSDVYGLGCTLYRLLTGDTPYHGETMVERILAHRTQPIPSLRAARPDTPPTVEAILTRMLAKQPEARPTMQEVADALAAAEPTAPGSSGIGLAKAPTPAEATYVGQANTIGPAAAPAFVPQAGPAVPRAGGVSSKTPRKRKSPLPLVLAGVAVAAAAGAGGWFFLQQPNQGEGEPAEVARADLPASAPSVAPHVPTPSATAPAPDPAEMFKLPSTAPSGTVSSTIPLPTATGSSLPAPGTPSGNSAATSSTATAVTGAAMSPAGTAGQVDLLPFVQLPQHVVAGNWSRNGTALIGNGNFARVQVPYTPAGDEYDLVLNAKLLQPADAGVVIGLVAQGRQFLMRVGRRSCGISDGDSTKPPNYAEGLDLPLAEPFTARCLVRRDSVRLDVNDRTVLEFRGDFAALSVGKTVQVPVNNQLFLGIDGHVGIEFTSLALSPVPGSPAVVATASPPAPPTIGTTPAPLAPTPPLVVALGGPSPIVRGSVDLLARVELPRDLIRGRWSRNGTKLIAEGTDSRVQVPFTPDREEYDVLLNGQFTRRQDGTSIVQLGLISQGRQFYTWVSRVNCSISDDDPRNPPNQASGLTLELDQPFSIRYAVRRSGIRYEVNGQEVFSFEGDMNQLSVPSTWAIPRSDQLFLSINGGVTFQCTSLKYVPAGQEAPRRPTPDVEARKAAIATIKEVFKNDYAAAKTPEQKSALSLKLVDQAKQTTGDPAARYVLLDEARTLAIEGVNLNALRDALLLLVREYDVDETAVILDDWTELLRRPRIDTATINLLSNEASAAFEDAVLWARFDDAKRYGEFAATAARRLPNSAATVKTINERNVALAARQKEWPALAAAAEKLTAAPDDPEANLAIGRYLALTAGDWPRALPLLAKGTDTTWKELAERSLAGAGTGDPNAFAALGDAWYDAAQKGKLTQRPELLAGAEYWYSLAAPTLTGLQKTRADKRLAETAALAPQRKLPPTDLPLRNGASSSGAGSSLPVRSFGSPPGGAAVPPPAKVSSVRKLPDGNETHTLVCSTPDCLRALVFDPQATQATVQGRELVLKSTGRIERCLTTYGLHFSSIRSVTIRGRIVPPSQREFRIQIGEINCILNWEDGKENHFRTGNPRTVVRDDCLTPGTTHTMHLACDGTKSTFSIDGKVLYESQTVPSGTVTLYTIRDHAIGIEELVITGVPDRSKPVTGPTAARVW